MHKVDVLVVPMAQAPGVWAFICLGGLLLLCSAASRGAAAERVLVENGVARSVIVVEGDASELTRLAADELQRHIQLASGAELPIVTPGQAEQLPERTVRVVIGPGSLAKRLGVDAAKLEPEQYRIKTVDNHVVFAGDDAGDLDTLTTKTVSASPVTLWAVCHFLDRSLGVRWLWPGEVGTFVPEERTIVVGDLDITGGPDLERRQMPSPGGGQETIVWKYHHMMGSRSQYGFGHSFREWWDKYHEEHPDYFAVPPEGMKQPYPLARRVKLCVSNPAVADQIVADWEAAGMPDNWNVGPNDSAGFCTCDRCCELDGIVDRDPVDVWRGNGVDLTRRYLALWNAVLSRMKQKNPEVTLSSFAYSAYRDAPEDVALEDGIVLAMVHSYWAYDEWKRWHDAGAKLFLRPNWWHMGACAPHLPLHKAGGYFRFAREHSMIGFRFDSLLGYWGTQGPYYYLIARLSARPDLTVDDAIEEYASAFGPAAPAIGKYLDYWETFTDAVAHPVPAGGSVSQDPEGLYEKACREHGLPELPLSGAWRVLPYLYTDDVLGDAHAILDEAEAAAAKDETARARIQFHRDGLTHLKMTCDVIGLAYAEELPEGMTRKDLARKLQELHRLRDELTPRHVVWGDIVSGRMATRRIKPETQSDELLNMEGL